MPVFQILEKIHLQNHTLEYEKLFILNRDPNDKELSKYLKQIARKKLSPFDDYFNRETHCYYAFKHPKGGLLTSKDPDIFNYLGFSHRKSGNLKLAEKYYDKALIINPKHKGALEYQGEMFLMKGQIIKAKENLKKLDEICFLGCKELDTLNLSIKMKLKGKKSKY